MTRPTASEVNGEDTKVKNNAGMISDVKNLYEGKRDNRGRFTWVDTYPDDIEEAAENAETARYALLIRNNKSFDSRKKFEINSIVVQSPLLKLALATILKDYPGITTTLDRLTFSAPFKPFVHRWSKLADTLKDEKDEKTKAHLELLYTTMEAELKDDLKARDDFIVNKVITWDTAWMIFEPGTIVFGQNENQDCAFKVKGGSYVETKYGNAFALDCEKIDWDGENFGFASNRLHIYEFQGTSPITRLPVYPLKYYRDLAKVKCELIEQGRAFEQLSGYHYKHYKGVAIGQGRCGPVKYNVESRIIIDTYAWNRFNPDRQVSLNGLGKYKGEASWNEDDEDEDYEDVNYDGDVDMQPGQLKGQQPLTKEQLLLCSGWLRGYSLRNKKWLQFSIDCVSDIKWNDSAFESLVLPNDHKELILALTESQVQNKDSFDDVIQGKGKGMIMLLSGPPGVGKTLTAESVAENMHVPLYMMSAGDLGLEFSGVESLLSNVLEMTTKWNAVLLLDEADVFLEQRSAHDLERNKLVSVFLRMLEYYEGILFLTTNRVDNLDAAFQSRIHISMEYSELSVSSRRHVWSNFLSGGGRKNHGFSAKDLDGLAEYKMNGCEIKNVLKTAQLLASKKEQRLGIDHVKSVLAIERRHICNEDVRDEKAM
ncbi:MAG: hypothetical protein Q9195_001209 [Heterodermia aff. obscurata]